MFESDFAKTAPQKWNLSGWMRPKRDAASGCGDARIDRYFALRALCLLDTLPVATRAEKPRITRGYLGQCRLHKSLHSKDFKDA